MYKYKPCQLSLEDSMLYSKVLPTEHPLMDIDNTIDFSFVEKELEPFYSKYMGRTCESPERLFRMLFLEFWANLSDVQVCDRLVYNFLYRWFCKIGINDQIPDDTTLVKFRKRLKTNGFHEKFFNHIVNQAKARDLPGQRWAIIDGTKIETYATIRIHTQFLRHGRHNLASLLTKIDTTLSDDQTLWDPVKRVDDKSFPNKDLLLAAEQEKGRQFVEYPEKLLSNTHWMTRFLMNPFPCISLLLTVKVLVSLVDPDAHWGDQKANESFCGYKTVIACDESGIATSVTVVPGNESENSSGRARIWFKRV